MENVIAVYCNSNSSSYSTGSEVSHTHESIPAHIRNRLDTARSLFSRLARSHADDSLIKVICFAKSRTEAELYARLSSLPDVRVDECINIADMVEKVLTIIGYNKGKAMNRSEGKGEDGIGTGKRVYFVLSNWQWQYIEPLLKLKDQHVRFFFEGALDGRSAEEIDDDRRMESIVKIKANNSIIDRFMSILTSDLKG